MEVGSSSRAASKVLQVVSKGESGVAVRVWAGSQSWVIWKHLIWPFVDGEAKDSIQASNNIQPLILYVWAVFSGVLKTLKKVATWAALRLE